MNNGKLSKFVAITVPVGFIILGWLLTDIKTDISELKTDIRLLNNSSIRNTQQIAAIQANIFTTQDGAEVWKAIGEIKITIADLPKEIPLIWFQNQLDKEFKAIYNRLNKLEKNDQ